MQRVRQHFSSAGLPPGDTDLQLEITEIDSDGTVVAVYDFDHGSGGSNGSFPRLWTPLPFLGFSLPFAAFA